MLCLPWPGPAGAQPLLPGRRGFKNPGFLASGDPGTSWHLLNLSFLIQSKRGECLHQVVRIQREERGPDVPSMWGVPAEWSPRGFSPTVAAKSTAEATSRGSASKGEMWHGLGSAVQLGPCQAFPSLHVQHTQPPSVREVASVMSLQLRSSAPAPSRSGHSLQHTFQPALLPCFPCAFLTLVLLRGAAAQWCLHSGSSGWSSSACSQFPWQVLWNFMWDLETGRTTFGWQSLASVNITTSLHLESMVSTLASAFKHSGQSYLCHQAPPASQGAGGSISLSLAGTAKVLYEPQPYPLSIWSKPPALS